MNSFGFIQIYTGDGKGKTTAAIGQAIRACGHGARVIMIQFMKGREYGELRHVANINNFDILQFGRDEFVDKEEPSQTDIEYAQQGLEKARQVAREGKYDLLILDEINVALDFGLIPLKDILELLREKPEKMEVILTGRNAAKELIDIAHLVTEMKEIKHPYRQGIEMREGIDY